MRIPTIEIILPVYNEVKNIPLLMQEMDGVAHAVVGRANLRYLFINDASTDGTGDLLLKISQRRSDVKVIDLVRNFGHGGAVHCGLEHFSGDVAVFMDADMQDSPRLVIEMFAEWEKGANTVVAERVSRAERFQFVFKFFYFLLNRVAKIPAAVNFGTYCLLDRRVVERMKQLKERNRYFPGLVSLSSGKIYTVKTNRQARKHGKSRMGLRRQFHLAMIALVSYSSTPVRLVSALGILSSGTSLISGVIIICVKLFTDKAIPGWASIMTVTFFASGLQLLCLGIIGEYMARVYDEVKGRPLYMVDRIFESSKQESSSHAPLTIENT